MKTCESRISQISRLLDEELAPTRKAELDKHLQECPDCAGQMRELVQLKALIEEKLETAIVLPDDADIVRHAEEASVESRKKRSVGRLVKRALIAAVACLAAVFLTAYLFFHFYFQRTFSHQLGEVVVRTSDGVEIKESKTAWRTLRAGDRLEDSTALRTPATARSFVSFDGIRILSEGDAEIELKGKRAFSFDRGTMVIASAERDRPLNVVVGNASIRTNGGTFRLVRSEDEVSLGVASGDVDVVMSGSAVKRVPPGEIAVLRDKETVVDLIHGQVADPFSRLKKPVMDRIKKQFAEVISHYIPDYQMTGRMPTPFGSPKFLVAQGRFDEMFRFASYDTAVSFKFAQTGTATIRDYYESLFAPGNRSISIGRQKTIPLSPGMAAASPTWSHDGSMLAFVETSPSSPTARVRVVSLDDPTNPWDISQECDGVLPFEDIAWAPDNRHVLFMMTDNLKIEENGRWEWNGPYKIKIAPIDPTDGPLRDFDSPFYDIPLSLPIPVGKTISPQSLKLPWGDAVLCANWGNIGYIPIEEDGQSVPNAPGLFLTNFDPREVFVMGANWAFSGSKIIFTAVENLVFDPFKTFILYDVEDILDGFSPPPRSLADPRIRQVASTRYPQIRGGFSFDESLVFFHEDVNNAWRAENPTDLYRSDFDFFYANTLRDQPPTPIQIHLPGNQLFLRPAPEGNRVAYCNYAPDDLDLRIVSFDIEANIDVDLGGVLIDNSGTNLIVPPGTLEENFGVVISTPFTIGEEAELTESENTFFAMRLIDAKGLDNPRFIEPMTLTIRYTDDEVAGLDEGMLEVYYYDETDPRHPVWVPLGGTVDPEYNEITVEIQHFSKFAVGGKKPDAGGVEQIGR